MTNRFIARVVLVNPYSTVTFEGIMVRLVIVTLQRTTLLRHFCFERGDAALESASDLEAGVGVHGAIRDFIQPSKHATQAFLQGAANARPERRVRNATGMSN
jgi:hypothetical protein